MTVRSSRLLAATAAALLVATAVIGAPAAWGDGPTTFTNVTAIAVADCALPLPCTPGKGNPYPSNITVSGMSGTVTKVTVTLKGVSHTFPDDIDVLLAGPGGQNLVLISDAGGGNSLSNVNMTFDDAAAGTTPDAGAWASPSKPVDYDPSGAIDNFPSPAPAPSSATALSAFNGTNPNGTWSLYVVDDSLGDTGSIAGGWSITITTAALTATTTGITSSNNPSRTGTNVTFTATVTSGGTNVGANGTVTFKEGATTLSGPTALNASGQAAFTTNTLTEGSHTITAVYSGTGSLGTSTGSVTQVVDNDTVVNGTSFCNTGSITINDGTIGSPTGATPYPSHVFVSGQPLSITKVTVDLKGVNHDFADDIDVLLVGPSGQNLILVSDAGGGTVLSNVTVRFDDGAAGSIPDTGAWIAASKPVNYGSGADGFPSPAPAPSAATALGAFNATNPNGTWSLYVQDDALGQTGNISAGWCLNITASGADTTPPVCAIVGIINGPPKQMQVSAQDPGTGLKSITNVTVTNATVAVDPFAVGTTAPVIVTATKTDQSQPAKFSFDAIDMANNSFHCT